MRVFFRRRSDPRERTSPEIGSFLNEAASVCAALLFFFILSVIAIHSGYAERERQLRSSLMDAGQFSEIQGVLNGIAGMDRFNREGRMKKITAADGKILAGATRVNNRLMYQRSFISLIARAAEVGMHAQKTVRDNQLPYDEYYTLLEIVEAEATGGDVKSKQLIANVVLNRVEDPHFPDTISEVVWEKVEGYAQFSPTIDGRIWSCDITDSTVEAVSRALEGENIAEGALFFVARSSADKSNLEWFDNNLVRLYEYGGHEFYTFREYKENEKPGKPVHQTTAQAARYSGKH